MVDESLVMWENGNIWMVYLITMMDSMGILEDDRSYQWNKMIELNKLLPGFTETIRDTPYP